MVVELQDLFLPFSKIHGCPQHQQRMSLRGGISGEDRFAHTLINKELPRGAASQAPVIIT